MRCNKCGQRASKEDKFCQNCGANLEIQTQGKSDDAVKTANSSNTASNIQTNRQKNQDVKNNQARQVTQPVGQKKNSETIKQIKKDTDKNAEAANVNMESKAESAAKWMTLVFVVLAVIIVVIAGAMFISAHNGEKVIGGDENTSSISDDTGGSTAVSSVPSDSQSTVSSEETIPADMLAENLQRKIMGSWSLQLPYKSMSIPATLEFDGKGKCSCELKALFISKKFDGSYKIQDGGSCSITLDGIEAYVSEGNTMNGTLSFASDEQMTFTSGNTVWKLIKNAKLIDPA